MKLGLIGCAVGRHQVDVANVRHAHSVHAGRCRCCHAPLEEVTPNVWEKLQVRDAGLGRRFFG